MSEWQLNTPVAFIIFNRLDTTERVFAEIAKAKPPKLLVVADGPRNNKPGEDELCVRTRAIIEKVNWNCEVLYNYSDINLGCKNRVSSGIDWVFEQVSEAVILEDDCLPNQAFFRFCEELLERYRDDERIGMISGSNLQFGQKRGIASYYFSRFTHIWGWATWRRAWKYYDCDAKSWPEFHDGGYLDSLVNDRFERKFWAKTFQSVYDGSIDTWDYQWVLSNWKNSMISIIPNANLVSNIGFGLDATHTKTGSNYSSIPVEDINFPLTHPEIICPNSHADKFTAREAFNYSTIRKFIKKLEIYREYIIRNNSK